MARLLRIENCWQCDECLSLPPATGEDPQWVCARKDDRRVFEHGYFIPDWCPLPQEGGWIPVGERLPEPGVRVLVVVEGGWIDVGIRDGDAVRAYSGGRVTHWQPLPALREEVNDGDA